MPYFMFNINTCIDRFKHEAAVFEPDLFDIYLSYCHKSNTTTPVTKSKGASAYHALGTTHTSSTYTSPSEVLLSTPAGMSLSQLESISPLYSLQDLAPVHIEGLSNLPASSGAKVAAVGQDGSLIKGLSTGTAHVVADKTSHSIYDFELQLLLNSSKKKLSSNDAASTGKDSDNKKNKVIFDFPTYKHGSFLLYNQRGLLETLPLSYLCVSVTGNVIVLEPSIYTLQQMPEPLPQSRGLGVGSVSKTSGYNYPSFNATASKSEGGSSSDSPPEGGADALLSAATNSPPIPQILANISTSPKELVMQIESLKSGMAYSAIIKFVQPVLLTDLTIPCTTNMSSVTVDVWLTPDEQATPLRVAQSSEMKTKSLMLGMLNPPPPCQFVKVRQIFDLIFFLFLMVMISFLK